MTNLERIACAGLAVGLDQLQRDQLATAVLAELRRAGLVILPATASARMRHEACKGTTGITTGVFGMMWERVVAYGRSLDGLVEAGQQHQSGDGAVVQALLADLQHLVRWHDQLSPMDIKRAEATIARVMQVSAISRSGNIGAESPTDQRQAAAEVRLAKGSRYG